MSATQPPLIPGGQRPVLTYLGAVLLAVPARMLELAFVTTASQLAASKVVGLKRETSMTIPDAR